MEPIIGIFLFTGLIVSLCSIPMILERVPPNRWVGFRTPRTIANPHLWYPANRIAGQYSLAAGVLVMITAGVVYVFRGIISPQSAATSLLVITPGVFAVALVLSFIALRRL